jgi:hypothetical protein
MPFSLWSPVWRYVGSGKDVRELSLAEMANGMLEEEAMKTTAMYNAYNKVFCQSSVSPQMANCYRFLGQIFRR